MHIDITVNREILALSNYSGFLKLAVVLMEFLAISFQLVYNIKSYRKQWSTLIAFSLSLYYSYYCEVTKILIFTVFASSSIAKILNSQGKYG